MKTTSEGADAEMQNIRGEAAKAAGSRSIHAQRQPLPPSASDAHEQHTATLNGPPASTSTSTSQKLLSGRAADPNLKHYPHARGGNLPRLCHPVGHDPPAPTTMPVKLEPSSDAAFASAQSYSLKGVLATAQGSPAGPSTPPASVTPRPNPHDAARAARRQSVSETSTRLRKKHEQTKHPVTYRLIASARPAQTTSSASSCKRERPDSVDAGEDTTPTLLNAAIDLQTSARAGDARVIGLDTDAMLIVKFKGETLLQRLSPPNYKKALKFGQHVRKGRELLDAFADDEDGKGRNGNIDCGLDGLGWTSGQAEDALLEWSWRLFHQHVHQLATLLEPELRSQLDADDRITTRSVGCLERVNVPSAIPGGRR